MTTEELQFCTAVLASAVWGNNLPRFRTQFICGGLPEAGLTVWKRNGPHHDHEAVVSVACTLKDDDLLRTLSHELCHVAAVGENDDDNRDHGVIWTVKAWAAGFEDPHHAIVREDSKLAEVIANLHLLLAGLRNAANR